MIKRRTFLKMLGAVVVAPSLPVLIPKYKKIEAIYGFHKTVFNNEEYATFYVDSNLEEGITDRKKFNPIFSGVKGVWDGVTFINT